MNKVNRINRKLQAIETKKKIYESAEHLFREFGFDNVSVDSIVEKAGVSKGAFYVHFPSKDALIAAFIHDFVNKLDLDYMSHFESLPANASSSESLISLVGDIVDIMTSTVGYQNLKYVYSILIAQTAETQVLLNYNRHLYKSFEILINQGIKQGEFKPELDIDTVTRHCVMTIRGLTYEWCIRYPNFDLKAETIQHFELLLTGIKK